VEFKSAVLSAVHRALVASGVPEADRFQRVLELGADDFRFDPAYPDVSAQRTDDFVLIEVLLSVGRSVKVKRKILADIIGKPGERTRPASGQRDGRIQGDPVGKLGVRRRPDHPRIAGRSTIAPSGPASTHDRVLRALPRHRAGAPASSGCEDCLAIGASLDGAPRVPGMRPRRMLRGLGARACAPALQHDRASRSSPRSRAARHGDGATSTGATTIRCRQTASSGDRRSPRCSAGSAR
jgi:hypothetical protein